MKKKAFFQRLLILDSVLLTTVSPIQTEVTFLFLCVYFQLNWGGEVPEEYYLSNQTIVKKENMKKVTVGRGSAYEHTIDIRVCGSILRFVVKEITAHDLNISLQLLLYYIK